MSEPVIPESMRPALERAFLLGFMATREGFNGECAFDHCAPRQLRENGTEEEMLESVMKAESGADRSAFAALRSEAMARMGLR